MHRDQPASSPRHVLIVDDDASARDAMRVALEKTYRVFEAPGIAGATRALRDTIIDIVVLDVVLGEDNGLDLLTHIREASDVPVLLVSGYGDKELVVRGLRARANDYLDKPFSATALLDRVQRLLGDGPAAQQVADRIDAFLRAHYMRDLTVPALAQEIRLSVPIVRHHVRRRYGKSVKALLEEVRLQHARTLVTTTDLSVKEIAARIGFRDPHYFARVFRRCFGQSPRGYRLMKRSQERPSATPFPSR